MKMNGSTLLRFLLFVGLLLVTAVTAHTQSDDPDSIPAPNTVTIAGTLQPQLGCPGEWNTECAESMLTYDPVDDLWVGTFDLTAGSYEYKAALNGSWDDNYGLNAEYYGPNIPLELTADGPVTFWYDHKTGWITDSINSLLANLPGDFQDEIGCPGDWQPDCLLSRLQDPDGDGLYSFVTTAVPAGNYEAKVAFNESWAVNYGADGAADGANIPFSVGEGQALIFLFDPETNLLTISASDEVPAETISGPSGSGGGGLPAAAAPFPDLVVIPGTIQSVAGCDGDWQPDCEATALNFDEEDQLWQATFDLPAGDYEYKVALNGSWDANFGQDATRDGPNIPLSLAADSSVSFYFDHNTGWVADSINSLIANVPGDFQDEIGCPGDWQPDCLASWLQDPEGDGIFTFQTVSIPAGSYEAKVAVNQSWDVNYGEGGTQDGANIDFAVPADGELVTFSFDAGSNLLSIFVGEGSGIQGNISEQRAHWVSADTIAWNIDHEEGNQYFFHFSRTGGSFSLGAVGINGGDVVPLTVNPAGLDESVLAKFPHLSSFTALTFPADFRSARTALKGQTAVSAQDSSGTTINATGLQIPGVIDDLYPYDGALGVSIEDGAPIIRLWAPTARSVNFHLFPDAGSESSDSLPMRVEPRSGVWTVAGEPGWLGQYYLFEVEVYVPSEGSVQTNIVTDPYSFSLSQNSGRSQIIDLSDPALLPDGWNTVEKPAVDAPESFVIYELHIRDFSANDPSVPVEFRGTYKAFTLPESNGMQHLAALAEAGLTHLHLLPSFDLATINEDKTNWAGPTFTDLNGLPPDSEEQQALITELRDQDPFNWGYDPWHYSVPEGSYSTDANGPTRILEYREMVQALNETGLRVVMDVVYNHTNASGQSAKSVLDRIVPGYYHRLNASGRVERSTCCDNTATEHNMMRKLMVDSIVTWATAYKIDGFRFDLMGHHMKEDMLAVRAALDGLTLAEQGVDGSSIYIYGEGWNFGEVADNARGVNATQVNMAGTGIGTFNDRLRDAVRGGSPFGGQTEQGFLNGLFTDPNSFDQGSETEQRQRLLNFADLIRTGLAGNLSDYSFTGASGAELRGQNVLYNGSPAGYTADPQENIVYISKHDNETLFDIIQYKAPLDTSTAERARMQTLGNALVMFSQGVSFFQAGDDLLRSKSLDRNSYNSGDWFNRLDFTYQTNNWGVGLPPAADNQDVWELMQPLLANPELAPTPADIAFTRDTFRELLQIHASTPLFGLETAVNIQQRLTFHNSGTEQVPGLIVMSIADTVGTSLDPELDMIVVLFNATPEQQSFTATELAGLPFTLHPVQQNSVDDLLREAANEVESGTFVVPARTAAVFVLAEGKVAEPESTATAETAADSSDEPETEATTAAATAMPAATAAAPEPDATTAAPDSTEEASDSTSAGTGTIAAVVGVGILLAAAGTFFLNRRRQQNGTGRGGTR